jgi:methionyl-tRNA synthetase
MMQAVGSDDHDWPKDVSAAMRSLAPGHAFTVPENLFRKITDEERAEWQQKFAGVRT